VNGESLSFPEKSHNPDKILHKNGKRLFRLLVKIKSSQLFEFTECRSRSENLLPFVRTKGNQKPPAEKKRAKLRCVGAGFHYGPLKETKAPAHSLQH
jgi:hypothetical protein